MSAKKDNPHMKPNLIKKITYLKNFGIFQDFVWDNDHLGEFKKFNLIYGWNRSGKTTISRVFASCEKKCIDEHNFKQYPPNGKFEIQTDDNITVNSDNVQESPLQVKVFNQDFVDDNISFDSSSSSPIVYISKVDISTKNRLAELKDKQSTLDQQYQQAQYHKKLKQQKQDAFLHGAGRTIEHYISTERFDKRDVQNRIKNIDIDNPDEKILADDKHKKYMNIMKEEPKNPQPPLSKYTFTFYFAGKNIDTFQKIFEAAKNILDKEIISETLERLKKDPQINNWVKQGFDLHKEKEEVQKCLFCQKPLDNGFLTSLSKHFNTDYDNLQKDIDHLKKEISAISKLPTKKLNNELYPGLRERYLHQVDKLEQEQKKIDAWIDDIIGALETKSNHPFKKITYPTCPDDFLMVCNTIIEALNNILTEHNNMANNHDAEVSKAREGLIHHTIAKDMSKDNYKSIHTELGNANKREGDAYTKVEKNRAEIQKLEAQTSNISTAISKINTHLKEFFGREEIKIELDADKKEYTIKRNGHRAKNLSESEKTAIAFAYFIVKAEEEQFNKPQVIFFIDDPISSFDSNFIYYCFSLIKRHFSNAGQLFISTHNFQFFNLVKKWFVDKNKKQENKNKDKDKKQKEKEPNPCEFFMIDNRIEMIDNRIEMINNRIVSNTRQAHIIPLDKILKKFKSEYHFLFARLQQFIDSDDSTQYQDLYTIGNIARRCLEIFIDFKIPTTDNLRVQMGRLIESISNNNKEKWSTKVDRVYKLINEFSHNSDPISVIEHTNKQESMNAIRCLLDIIKQSDPEHFNIMEKETAVSDT